jgi:NADP-dependent 3-hydroxy acid dehydrogenase YdfG
VDILIANPDGFVPAVERDDAEMQQVIEGISYSVHRLCRAALSQMLERKCGKIVPVSGTAGLKRGEGRLAGAARGAQQAYFRNAALGENLRRRRHT